MPFYLPQSHDFVERSLLTKNSLLIYHLDIAVLIFLAIAPNFVPCIPLRTYIIILYTRPPIDVREEIFRFILGRVGSDVSPIDTSFLSLSLSISYIHTRTQSPCVYLPLYPSLTPRLDAAVAVSTHSQHNPSSSHNFFRLFYCPSSVLPFLFQKSPNGAMRRRLCGLGKGEGM